VFSNTPFFPKANKQISTSGQRNPRNSNGRLPRNAEVCHTFIGQYPGFDIQPKTISDVRYSIRIDVFLAMTDLYYTPIQNFFVDLERYE